MSRIFRPADFTGVIYVMTRAASYGYLPSDTAWVNFGQGQPETSALPDGPPRPAAVSMSIDDLEYSAVGGLKELRGAVADYYNRNFRRGMRSQYQAENVCIAPGGRASLTRIAASLGEINLGHFLPDYTAYEELLGRFRSFNPIPIMLEPQSNYEFSANELRREILGRGLGALLLSNPCNPTGKLIHGSNLQEWVDISSELDCALIFDEFYSHYIWNDVAQTPLSASCYVEDVNTSKVLIVDGLTKNWRLPGWRISWTIGPKDFIETLESAGSFLDGGAARPLQRSAIALLEQSFVDQESSSLHKCFKRKRNLLLEGLVKLGILVATPPEGGFYIWGDVSQLGPTLNSGLKFFEVGLKSKLICVPGVFFDVDPGQRRKGRASRFEQYVRFSFGPSETSLRLGLQSIATVLNEANHIST